MNRLSYPPFLKVYGSLEQGAITLDDETFFSFTLEPAVPYRAQPLYCTVTGEGDCGTLVISAHPFGDSSSPSTIVSVEVRGFQGVPSRASVGPIAYDGSTLYAVASIGPDGAGTIEIGTDGPREVDPVVPSPGFSGITTIIVKDAQGYSRFYAVGIPTGQENLSVSCQWYGDATSSPGGPVGIITVDSPGP
jgi:hypothetical protein